MATWQFVCIFVLVGFIEAVFSCGASARKDAMSTPEPTTSQPKTATWSNMSEISDTILRRTSNCTLKKLVASTHPVTGSHHKIRKNKRHRKTHHKRKCHRTKTPTSKPHQRKVSRVKTLKTYHGPRRISPSPSPDAKKSNKHIKGVRSGIQQPPHAIVAIPTPKAPPMGKKPTTRNTGGTAERMRYFSAGNPSTWKGRASPTSVKPTLEATTTTAHNKRITTAETTTNTGRKTTLTTVVRKLQNSTRMYPYTSRNLSRNYPNATKSLADQGKNPTASKKEATLNRSSTASKVSPPSAIKRPTSALNDIGIKRKQYTSSGRTPTIAGKKPTSSKIQPAAARVDHTAATTSLTNAGKKPTSTIQLATARLDLTASTWSPTTAGKQPPSKIEPVTARVDHTAAARSPIIAGRKPTSYKNQSTTAGVDPTAATRSLTTVGEKPTSSMMQPDTARVDPTTGTRSPTSVGVSSAITGSESIQVMKNGTSTESENATGRHPTTADQSSFTSVGASKVKPTSARSTTTTKYANPIDSTRPTASHKPVDPCTAWERCSVHHDKQVRAWLSMLPACPCTFARSLYYNSSLYDKLHRRYFHWRVVNNRYEKLSVYKPTAAHCIRQLVTGAAKTVATQQCCYDRLARLLTRGSGAGTPNLVSPELNRSLHVQLDLMPYYTCQGDWTRYQAARPPNNALNCRVNPLHSEFRRQVRKAREF